MVLNRGVIQCPIELKGLIDKFVLNDLCPSPLADLDSRVSAERIDNDDVICETLHGSETSVDLCLVVIRKDDYRNHRFLARNQKFVPSTQCPVDHGYRAVNGIRR